MKLHFLRIVCAVVLLSGGLLSEPTLGQTIRVAEILVQLQHAETELRGSSYTGRLVQEMQMQGTAPNVQRGARRTQYEFHLAYEPWGYRACRLPDANSPTNFEQIVVQGYALRSNNTSIDIETLALGSNAWARAKFEVEMSIKKGLQPSFIPTALWPSDFRSLLLNMKDLVIVSKADDLLELTGNLENHHVEEKWFVTCSQTHGMFPVKAKVYRGSFLVYEWNATFSRDSRRSYVPESITATLHGAGSTPLLSESYTELMKRESDSSLHWDAWARTPKGTVVNEYRFDRPFAYILGARPPDENELQAMARSDEAIRKYQVSSILITLGNSRIPSASQKWIIRIVFALTAAAPIIWILYRSSRRSKLNPTRRRFG